MFYPDTLNLFLTDQCNLACRYCYITSRKSSDNKLDLIFFKKAVDSFLKLPVKNKVISFSGGEPFLKFKEIKKLYEYIKNNTEPKPKFTITTNGTLITKNRLRYLEKEDITLTVSIDGKKETHDINRPFKSNRNTSSYNRILDNLNGCCQKDKIKVQLVFTPATVNNLVENIKFLWKMGFQYIDFYPQLYCQWSKKDLNLMAIKFKEFTDFYIYLLKNCKKNRVFNNSLLQNFIEERVLYKPIICRNIFLDGKGNYYLCNKVFSLPQSKRKKFIIGDFKNGIDIQLRSKMLKQKRNEIRNLVGKDCRLCRYLKYCFCPIGDYIYFSSLDLDFKQYFPQFCRLSQIYINSFLEIKKTFKR